MCVSYGEDSLSRWGILMLTEDGKAESKTFLKSVPPLSAEETRPVGPDSYRFGAWILSSSEMRLTRDGETVALTPKTFDLLVVFLRSRGRLLTVSDLMNAVWPGVSVGKANVHQTISVLRKALGTRSDRKSLIVSVPRRGYRFGVEVEVIADENRARDSALSRGTGRARYSSEAKEYFVKGLHCFERWSGAGSRVDTENAIALFREAVRIEPKWALPQSQLAYAYTVMALFFEPEGRWAENANDLLARANSFDDRTAEVHVVRSEMLWSPINKFQIEAAARELKQAQTFNPETGQAELGIICAHQGFEQPALERLERALKSEPASIINQSRLAESFIWLGKYRQAITGYDRLIALDPYNPGHYVFSAIASVYAGESNEACRRNDQALALKPSDPIALSTRALLQALEGDFEAAENGVSELTTSWRSMRSGHHVTQNIAAIYALQGKSDLAVGWLRKTIRMGMCNYRMIQGDPNLERVRGDSTFRDFMTETKLRSNSLLPVLR